MLREEKSSHHLNKWAKAAPNRGGCLAPLHSGLGSFLPSPCVWHELRTHSENCPWALPGVSPLGDVCILSLQPRGNPSLVPRSAEGTDSGVSSLVWPRSSLFSLGGRGLWASMAL